MRRRSIGLSHFCYRRRKPLALQGPRKLPKLAAAGSTPVARSRENLAFDPGHTPEDIAKGLRAEEDVDR